MKKLISNLKVSRKLYLISAAFILPVLFLLYALTTEQNIRIDFGQKELYGDQYLRPLRQLFEIAPQIKYNSSIGISNSSTEQQTIIQKIDDVFKSLDEVDAELNEYLTTTDKLNELKSSWDDLKTNIENSGKQDKFNSSIRGLISYVGDMSNLILDPDLDSFYLMDATLLKLPENWDLQYQLLTYVEGLISKGFLTPDEKTELTVKLGLLKNNTIALDNDLKVAFNNNPAANLKNALGANIEKCIEVTNRFTSMIDENILKPDSISISGESYRSVANSAIEENFKFWDSTIFELDGLLQARIDGFTGSKYLTLISIGILLLVTLSFVYFISKNITTSISELSDSAQKFAAGDDNVEIKLQSADELGKLGEVFNQMIRKIQESILQIKKEKESVDKKIELAVKESELKNAYLNESVNTMLNGIEKFANGNLDIELKIINNDEIGKLFGGFNKAVKSIRKLVVTLNEAINSTAESSRQISVNSNQIAAGINEQSMQANEVVAAVEEMTKTIFETSQNTENASSSAKRSGEIAKEGGKVVNETIEGMVKISGVVQKAAQTVMELGNSSDQIGEIIQVIDDIADQTNLLALNAAIEAARAGEQGRGFAVVADEVRKLAERTTKATKEIAGMIKLIQEKTAGAVESMNEGTLEVEKGKKLTDRAGESLNEIIRSAEELVDSVSQVAVAGQEQSSAAEQISKNLVMINDVTQENASGVQQIAHSAGKLDELTNDLKELISKFQFTENELASKMSSNSYSDYKVRPNGKVVVQ
ncbi:MAG: methyl-accepting chemotaxis protein [bacterium]